MITRSDLETSQKFEAWREARSGVHSQPHYSASSLNGENPFSHVVMGAWCRESEGADDRRNGTETLGMGHLPHGSRRRDGQGHRRHKVPLYVIAGDIGSVQFSSVHVSSKVEQGTPLA